MFVFGVILIYLIVMIEVCSSGNGFNEYVFESKPYSRTFLWSFVYLGLIMPYDNFERIRIFARYMSPREESSATLKAHSYKLSVRWYCYMISTLYDPSDFQFVMRKGEK